ncbi:hypothetical protein GCM10029992_58450 [Glycomyces albus]
MGDQGRRRPPAPGGGRRHLVEQPGLLQLADERGGGVAADVQPPGRLGPRQRPGESWTARSSRTWLCTRRSALVMVGMAKIMPAAEFYVITENKIVDARSGRC